MPEGFFEALYERLLLRDFVGKIVPGTALIATFLGVTAGWQWTVVALSSYYSGSSRAIAGYGLDCRICSSARVD